MYVKSSLIAHSLLNRTTIWNAMNFGHFTYIVDVMVSAHYVRLDRSLKFDRTASTEASKRKIS